MIYFDFYVGKEFESDPSGLPIEVVVLGGANHLLLEQVKNYDRYDTGDIDYMMSNEWHIAHQDGYGRLVNAIEKTADILHLESDWMNDNWQDHIPSDVVELLFQDSKKQGVELFTHLKLRNVRFYAALWDFQLERKFDTMAEAKWKSTDAWDGASLVHIIN